MPYNQDTSTIRTKVIGVNASDESTGVQQILFDLAEDPAWARIFYLKGLELWMLTEDGRNFRLGTVKEKYRELLNDNNTVIRSWRITGGGPLDEKYKGLREHLGMNIEIKLQKK